MLLSLSTQPSLLVRLRDPRDHEAWARFVDLYAPLVYGFLRRRRLQDADAADLTQDVLRQVAGAASSFAYDRAKGTFRSWLFTVVRNRLTDHLRRTAASAHGAGGSSNWRQLQEQLVAPDTTAADSAEWDAAWRRQLFQTAAQQVRADFSEPTWNAFWQTAVDGRVGQEVATEQGMSIAAVYLAKSRVMKRIKEQIQWLQGEDDSSSVGARSDSSSS